MAWIHGQSEWDQKLGKIECVCSLYDKMRWKWGAVYLPRGLPNIYSVSLIPPLLPLYLCTPTVAHSTSVTPVSPYTHRRSFHLCYPCISVHPPSLFNDIFGVRHWSSVGMHWEAVIVRVWRCTWRRRWSELRDALGGRDWLSLEMHWEAQMEWTQRCTWRPWSSEFGDALGGRDRVNSEMHMEAVINRVWRCTGRQWPREFADALAGYDRARLEE